MAQDRDDGSGDDRTVIRPNPGGRRPEPASGGGLPPGRPSGAPPPSPVITDEVVWPSDPSQAAVPVSVEAPLVGRPGPAAWNPTSTGHNPLIDASIALLMLISQIRTTAQHSDVAGLRNQLVQQIGEFERTARDLGESPETVNAARYCLCTALDEAVAITPWGSSGIWSSQSLLVTFHKETWGGDKLFRILENLIQKPGDNVNLLELLYVILCLGFEGKFRVLDRGSAQLEELRMAAFERLRPYRGEFERELSPTWRGVDGGRRHRGRQVPLLVIAAMVIAVVVVSHSVMSYVLSESYQPVIEKLERIPGAPSQ